MSTTPHPEVDVTVSVSPISRTNGISYIANPRLKPASDCHNCSVLATRVHILEQQIERLTRAIQREADATWDVRTPNSGK